MFNLEKEVEKWIQAVQGPGCSQADSMEELQDHLYSEIERLQASGLSDEQAFIKATEQLGKADDLNAEYSKNKSFIAKLFDFEMAHFEKQESKYNLTPRQTTVLTIGHSLLFATAMILFAWLMRDSDTSSTVTFAILMPLWFVTFMFLPGINHSMRCEWQAIKQIFGTSR
jgi:hypothetical protein